MWTKKKNVSYLHTQHKRGKDKHLYTDSYAEITIRQASGVRVSQIIEVTISSCANWKKALICDGGKHNDCRNLGCGKVRMPKKELKFVRE